MEAYSEWMFTLSKYNFSSNDKKHKEVIFNQNDLQFYMIYIKIMISMNLN